jgi:integrase/recombinase XerD
MDDKGYAQSSLFPGDISRDSSLKATLGPFDIYMIGEKEFTENTRKAFLSDMRLLGEYFRGGQPVGDIGAKELNDYLKWLLHERDVPCSQKSYARRVTTLKVFFGWLSEKGYIPSNPSLDVIQVSVTSPLPNLPSDEDIEKALSLSMEMLEANGEEEGDSRPKLLLTLLLKTGINKMEAMSIVLNHINRVNPDAPYLFIRYKNPKKRYKERKMLLDPGWIILLERYVDEYQPSDTLFTCTARNLEYILTDIGEQTGLPKGSLSFENLRWIYALRKYREGINHDKLIYQLGITKVTWRQTKSKLDRLAAKGQPVIS